MFCLYFSQIPLITVTIQLIWDVKDVPKSLPRPYTTIVPQGTVLKTILHKAALTDSAYSFTSWYFPGLGDVITSIDGVYQDNSEHRYWTAYENPKGLVLTNIDTFQPQHGSTITFAYVGVEKKSSVGDHF